MTALLVGGWATALAALVAAWHGADRARRLRQLAAAASHEVRGPLSAAQLALDGLTLRGEPDAAGSLALELQLRRARRALDDLVLRTPAVTPVRMPLRALAAEIEAVWTPVAAARDRALVVDAPGTDAATVRVDVVRLAQAVGNLVANALDHGAGTVRVSVEETGGEAAITVADDGVGPARPLGELLRPSRPAAGSVLAPHGHGLRVVADVAARAGGRLTVDGAAFTLWLPVRAGVASVVVAGAAA